MRIINVSNIEINTSTIVNQIKLVEVNYTLLQNEVDVTTTENIELLFNVYGLIDYKTRRRMYKYLSNNFSSQNTATKKIICDLCAASATTIVTYYVSSGMTLADAQYKYLMNRSIDIIEAAKCCATYIESPKFFRTVLYYLPLAEAERFLDNIQDLSIKFKTAGHFGKKYGDKTDGLFDYIESYGTFESGGLKDYTLNSGLLLSNFVTDLMDILYLGKYY